jgi:signal transduction histidine kinase
VSRREPLDAAWVVREAAGEAAPIALGHNLSVDVPSAERLVVEGSADELHRLVLNLIQNALVHTPAGTTVEVRARREGDQVAIEVSDEGPGIPPELRAQIFDRFVRGEGDRGGSTGGSGLGLSIVRAVAESHGGSVELADSESGGAHFTVRLPSAKLEPGAAADQAPPPEPAAAQ